uniref:Isoleucine--tRNA ligase n=1 Tax=uncultured marine thaumarchaeote AD1000_80_F03 TaxID=1455943 RepID=A0A075G432_9ARCH|nr:isoleucyl-tRNA synthetase (IARS, ileS) [uncultured marine thaumarchaeote AD1000_80_F03]
MELTNEFNLKKIEQSTKDYLSKLDLQKMIDDSSDKRDKIMFIEGPPTLNGEPHAGHLRGRVFKDLWYRFNTLNLKNVIFNAGWDTQGLPVELQAEKELGITDGKSGITTQQQIENLVAQCKKIVSKFHQKWIDVDEKLGMSLNQENAYWTYKDEYIEREWQLLKCAHENGILTEGYRVVAYCPSCQTSLSHSEVNQGYEMVQDPSLYYKVKLQDEDVYLIVWTTMPFTLVTDAMVGFNPDEEYVYVSAGNETWIVGKIRLEEFMKEAKIEDYKVLKTVNGSEFEGKKYTHPLLGDISGLEKMSKLENYHIAVAEKFVDVNAGTGIVHLSPANGEDDYNIAMKRKVEIFSPIDDEVKFTEDAGRYAGMFVRDADEKIVQDVKDKNALVRIGKIKHKYPLCWRSKHKLVWLARREYFYMLDRLDDKAVDAAQKVEYFFDQPKNRFLEIIKEKHPWCISRERFWGCPLPIWKCTECENIERLFSRKEIVDVADDLPDGPDFELHRPWIDRVSIKCKKCSAKMQREEFVLDTWHNSGAAPFASLSDDEYKKTIPAPFFTEGIDQTRGWAYTLLIENVIFNNKDTSPYNSFLFQGHVLDEKGNKMSKSTGNVLDAADLLDEYPVDLVRFYFMWKSSPIETLNFSTKELMSRPYQILSTLFHIHLYFKQNSEYDKFNINEATVGWAKDNDMLTSTDIWLLSKLQKTIELSTKSNNECKFHESASAIEDFLINSLSQIYIPITKPELWNDDENKKDRRHVIYAIIAESLKTLDILIHPFSPFTSEYLYTTTFGDKESILLETWPKSTPALVNESVEESFDIMNEIVSVCAAARMKGKLKRRWPLKHAIICVEKGLQKKIELLSELLQSQLNVEDYKIIELENHEGISEMLEMKKSGVPVIPKIELNRKTIGPKAKQNLGKLLEIFSETKPDEIIQGLEKDSSFTFDVNGTKISLDTDDFIIEFDVQEDFTFSRRNNLIGIISTERNEELMAKGLIKDLARRLQALRKERGYNPTDVLNTASVLDLDEESLSMIKNKTEDLSFLVRVKQVNFTQTCKKYKDDDIDGQKIRISVE